MLVYTNMLQQCEQHRDHQMKSHNVICELLGLSVAWILFVGLSVTLYLHYNHPLVEIGKLVWTLMFGGVIIPTPCILPIILLQCDKDIEDTKVHFTNLMELTQSKSLLNVSINGLAEISERISTHQTQHSDSEHKTLNN